ncbi:MAG: thrombospondin type 3 repeat-containing protein [Nannocystales bacterium]
MGDPQAVRSTPDAPLVGLPRVAVLVVAAALSAGWAAPAHAAPGDTVRHSASVNGHLATDSSQVLPAWTPSAGVATTYLRSFEPVEAGPSVDARLQTDLLLAFGIADWAQLEMDLPMVLHQRGATVDGGGIVALPGAAVGDIRLGARGTFLRTPRRGFGLGIGFDATVPSGREDALTTYGGGTYTPSLLAEYRGRRGVAVATNVGYSIRPEVNYGDVLGGDALPVRLAVRVPVAPRDAFALFAELDGQASMVQGADSPVALRGGFRWQTRGGLVMQLWGGGSVLSSVGLPSMQVGLSAAFAPIRRVRTEPAFEGSERPGAAALARDHDRALMASMDRPPATLPPRPADPDGDGVLARADLCPTVPEDRDGTQDGDGCPELDDDRDGIPDVVDLCPAAPEVINGYRDLDGCPDRRLADGKGETFETFEARQLLPALHFAEGSAAVDPTMGAQLDEIAELLRLNPWIERLQLAVFVPKTRDAAADGRLAQARTEAIRKALDDRGVDRWRVEALAAKTVAPGTPQRVRLTLSGRARALDPIAPAPATFERIIAEAYETAAEAPDTMEAQGPEPTQPPSAAAR